MANKTKEQIIEEIMNEGKQDWWCWACGQNPCDDECNDKEFTFDEEIVFKMLEKMYYRYVKGDKR